MKKFLILSVFLFLGCCQEAGDQEIGEMKATQVRIEKVDKEDKSPREMLYEAFNTQNFLDLHVILAGFPKDDRSIQDYFQFIGEKETRPRKRRSCSSLSETGYVLGNWNDVLEAASQTPLVVINEDHQRPSHRLLIQKLGNELRAEGFDYYAAETFDTGRNDFNSWQELVMSRGFAENSDGYYSSEPVFSELIVSLLADGYKPVAYDVLIPPTDSENGDLRRLNREFGQATNLYNRVFAKDQDAKLLVHVGHSHVFETPDAGRRVWMGTLLTDILRTNPLTISQTECISSTASLKSPEIYFYQNYDEVNPKVDIIVAWPPSSEFSARQERSALDMRQVYNIEFDPKEVETILFEAFPSSAGLNTLAFDRVIYNGDGEQPQLVLSSGEYRLTATSLGKLLHEEKLIVVP